MSKAINNKKLVSYKRNLISLFHCTMLSLSAYERTNPDSDKVKTSRNQLSWKIDNVFSKTGNDLAVCSFSPLVFVSKNKNWRKEKACNYLIVDFTFQDCDFALSILEFVQQSDLTAEWEKKCLHEAEKYINSEVSPNLQCFGEFN